jgi:lipopolysaccharide transport system permease protein
VRRDFQVRSIRAIWGSAWLVIQPALQIFIYTVIFSQVLAAKLPGTDDGQL